MYNINIQKVNGIIICILLVGAICNLKCTNAFNTTRMVIKGDLKGLPDGTMILIGRTFDGKNINIDSTMTTNGHFYFSFYKHNLPHLLKLEHYDDAGVKMIFSFKTNKRFRGGPLQSEYFMSDDAVSINGNLTDFIPKDFQLPSNIRLVYPDEPIRAGKQTFVMYNVSYNFNQPITDSSMNVLIRIIRQYSYSYYLIKEINDHRSSFTNRQINTLLLLFNKQVQQSDVAASLKQSLKYRNDKPINNVAFLDRNSNQQLLNTGKTKITMIVLWASWCQPCRMEVPVLREIYSLFSNNSNFQIISISLDSKKEEWQKELAVEKMPWQQLIVPPEMREYTNDIFKFDGVIPTTIFLNESGAEISRVSGYEENLLENYKQIISKNLN